MKEQQSEQIDQNLNQPTEEQLANSLNTDENRSGTEGIYDMTDDGDSGLQKDLDEARDKYLRLAAEFDNYKRRTSRERLELIQTAGKEIVESMLDVIDDSERAAKNLDSSDDVAQIKSGVMLVFNKLKSTMQAKGLKVMEAQGTDFDPELHEAITEVPAGNDAMVGKVIDVIVPGYYLNDKLIRHAKVVVGK